MQTIELTGNAVFGVGPSHAKAAVAALPTQVCLGVIKPKSLPMVPKMSAYMSREVLASAPLPSSTNRRDKAASAMARMYCNDQLGCCVISGKAHSLGVWSANDSDSGGIVLATDAEIRSQYAGICGPGDNGCVITDVLDVMRSRGFTAAGKSYKIDGYVSVDHTNQELVKAAILIFGSITIGIDLPSAWTNDAVWDVTTTGIVGGHDVSLIDYDDSGVYVSSWGRIYRMTWPACVSTKWITEMYALLAPLWYGSNMIAPCGLDATALQADLQKLANGVVPDIEPPAPPIPTPTAQYQITLGSDLPAGPCTITSSGVTLAANNSTVRPAGTYLLTRVDPLPPH